MLLDKIHVFSRHPPLEQQEKQAIHDQDDSVYRAREEPELHRALHSLPQVHLWRFHDGVVYGLRPLRDLVPVVEALDALVRAEGIMSSFRHDLDRFPDRAADV